MSAFTLEAAPARQVNSSANTPREQSVQGQVGGKTTFGAPATSSAFNGSLGNSMFGSSLPGSRAFSASGSNGTASRPYSLSGSMCATSKTPENQGFGFQRRAPGQFSGASLAPRPQQDPIEQPAQSKVPEKPSFSDLISERRSVDVSHQARVSTEEDEGSLFIPEQSTVDRGDDVEVIGEDVLMFEAPRTPSTPKPQQHIPNMIPSPCPTGPSTPVTPSTPNFRKPIVPASATKDAISAFKNVRAGSQVSASSMPAQNLTRSHRNASVVSGLSSSSRTATIRKRNRKVVNLSSDEDESDYAPEPSDDEEENLELPLGVGQEPKADKTKMRKVQPGPVSKKAKTDIKTGKNPFGFDILAQSMSNVKNSQLVPSTLKKLPKPSPQTTLPPSTKKPISANMKPKKSPRLPAHRSSKLAAASKISQQLAVNADSLAAQEAPESGAVENVRDGLRSMSLTPVLSDKSTEDVEALAGSRLTGTGGRGKALRSRPEWMAWTKRRQTGDRQEGVTCVTSRQFVYEMALSFVVVVSQGIRDWEHYDPIGLSLRHSDDCETLNVIVKSPLGLSNF
ncbi:Nucleo-P87 domain containing protein [Pyrenophora tritici-repentis]|uniref:Nucleo-P87 domain containing protein n=1 Tax=Pyrenophora tritici-repentis TaxID=45151 RepID=A0A834S6B1_9PLEO|nr:Nucleo-P87 domain containing protein [Pyrenophora tritici-repentis]